jgi:hypothetical protein
VSSDTEFWVSRVATIKAQLVAYDAMYLSFLSNGGQQSYKLDTGQEVVTVDRADLADMDAVMDSLLNRLDVACIRAGLQSSSVFVRGAY